LSVDNMIVEKGQASKTLDSQDWGTRDTPG
jgi:hypothetical protein